MDLQRQWKKSERNIKTSGFQSRYCYSLMEELPDFLVFSPENMEPLSIPRVTSVCFTCDAPVRIVGPLNFIKYQNLHKLSTFLYLYYK